MWDCNSSGMAAASKPHMLHLSLSVYPVKNFSNGLWSEPTSRSAIVGQMNTFLLK